MHPYAIIKNSALFRGSPARLFLCFRRDSRSPESPEGEDGEFGGEAYGEGLVGKMSEL